MSSEELCSEKHKHIAERLSGHENWLNEHETQLDVLNRSDAANTRAIVDLCGQLSGLVKAIWGLVGISITALVGFFVYAVQMGVFKK